MLGRTFGKQPQMPAFKVHPTAIIDNTVKIGAGSAIWDSVHIRENTVIGENCIIGEKTYIAYNVVIGSQVKINAMVYICTGVTIEDGVMISAGTVFTNDSFPRAANSQLNMLLPSEPNEHTTTTFIRRGATIGANCTVGSNLEVGQFAMLGMGSVLTKSLHSFHLAFGNPARSVGAVCRCGQLLCYFDNMVSHSENFTCKSCSLKYHIDGQTVRED